MPQVARRNAETLDVLIALFTEQGFLALSVEDMARLSRRSKSTLYGVAPSKDGIIEAVVREFFRQATERIERQVAGESPRERIASYLSAIATSLAPVCGQFVTDLGRFPPAREIYHSNIRAASQRVQQLALAALPAGSAVDPCFVGVVAGVVMEAIHQGDIGSATGLSVAEAYSALAELISAAIGPETTPNPESDRL